MLPDEDKRIIIAKMIVKLVCRYVISENLLLTNRETQRSLVCSLFYIFLYCLKKQPEFNSRTMINARSIQHLSGISYLDVR